LKPKTYWLLFQQATVEIMCPQSLGGLATGTIVVSLHVALL
jgi:hypothetical protein